MHSQSLFKSVLERFLSGFYPLHCLVALCRKLKLYRGGAGECCPLLLNIISSFLANCVFDKMGIIHFIFPHFSSCFL